MDTDQLIPSQAHTILGRAGGTALPNLSLVKRHNHVYRIDYSGESFFLKTYTKDWYAASGVLATGGCVQHEVMAWAILAANGLSVPEVVVAGYDCENPMGRPFVVTRMLRGRPLTECLQQADPVQFGDLLRGVGSYLRQMHAITFDYPGYLMSMSGASAPPDPNQWQHRIWTLPQYKLDTLRDWQHEAATLPPELVKRMHDLLAQHERELAAAFQPPRYTHGDCHAHQFFMYSEADGWRVSGVVDMEVTSAGDCGADHLRFFIEMAGRFDVSSRWWEALFEGYGIEPDFELMRLRFMAAESIIYKCFGQLSWPGTRTQILMHILDANDWSDLFNLKRITL